jgi:hypothetical protein
MVPEIVDDALHIVKTSEYLNPLTDEQDKIVNALVREWNNIIEEYEHKSIRFAFKVKEILKGCPDATVKEIMEKVKDHPDIKVSASKTRIIEGLRVIETFPKLQWWAELTPEQKKEVPYADKPYLKRDGSVLYEFYFELSRYRIDPGIAHELAEKGKNYLWSCRKTRSEVNKYLDKTRDPNSFRRKQKQNLIRELLIIVKDLQPDDLTKIKEFAIKNYNDRLVNYNKWLTAKTEAENNAR